MTSPIPSNSVHEHLLGYLMGALEADEQALVEREIQNNPEIKQRLTTLAAVLKPLDYDRDHPEYDPPADLAMRTCGWLAAQTADVVPAAAMHADGKMTLGSAHRMSETREIRGRRGFSMADMVVAAGIFLAASMLFFPALSNSRNQAHLIACQDNLRQIGYGLAGYSDAKGTFPQIPVSGNQSVAGIYAPILYNQGDGFMVNPKLLKCPSSKFGNEKGQWRGVPSLAQIDAAQGPELKELQQTMGGSYGYNLGYHVNGRYSAPRRGLSPEFALMADAPSSNAVGVRSENHGGRGHNVLFADGHLQYLTDSVTGRTNDDLFRNRLNRIAAGVDSDDSVIGRSDASPFGE